MKTLKPLGYVLFLISVYFLDRFIQGNYQAIVSFYRSIAELFVEPDSLFLGERFFRSVYRVALSFSTLAALFVFLPLRRREFSVVGYFKIHPITAILFLLLFIHMNSRSQNSGHLLYATLSYLSIMVLMLREQIVFTSQVAYCSNWVWLWVLSVLSMAVFIISHPIELSVGRVTAAILIFNLMIYTLVAANIWHGVVVHAAWNYAFPESALFHYTLLFYSFWLAFGRREYPEMISSPFDKIASNTKFEPAFRYWRLFWSFPNQAAGRFARKTW